MKTNHCTHHDHNNVNHDKDTQINNRFIGMDIIPCQVTVKPNVSYTLVVY